MMDDFSELSNLNLVIVLGIAEKQKHIDSNGSRIDFRPIAEKALEELARRFYNKELCDYLGWLVWLTDNGSISADQKDQLNRNLGDRTVLLSDLPARVQNAAERALRRDKKS
jgi:hypothetical protein